MNLLQEWFGKARATFIKAAAPEKAHYVDIDSQLTAVATATPVQIDSKMARLMELMGSAIEMWAEEYHLENMPKQIIFGQALDAMHIVEQTFNSEKK